MAAGADRPPRRTQRERVEESGRRVFEAAVALIAEQGFDRTTTAQISDRAGFSNSMVNTRYGSKESLLEALLRSYEDRLFESQISRQHNGMQQLLGQIDAVRQALKDDPQFLRAFMMIIFQTPGSIPKLKPWLVDWLDRYVDHIADTIRRGQADGSVRRDIDPKAEGVHFVDVSTGPLFRWILNPDEVNLDAELAAWSTRTQAWFAHPPTAVNHEAQKKPHPDQAPDRP
jgi:AcrR family transcriptional regulator